MVVVVFSKKEGSVRCHANVVDTRRHFTGFGVMKTAPDFQVGRFRTKAEEGGLSAHAASAEKSSVGGQGQRRQPARSHDCCNFGNPAGLNVDAGEHPGCGASINVASPVVDHAVAKPVILLVAGFAHVRHFLITVRVIGNLLAVGFSGQSVLEPNEAVSLGMVLEEPDGRSSRDFVPCTGLRTGAPKPSVPVHDGVVRLGEKTGVANIATGAFVSEDGGKTWPRWTETFPNDRFIYWESKILVLPDRRLLSVAWVHDFAAGKDKANHFAIGSPDASQWSAPRSMDIWGQTLSSIVLPDGRILSVYRRMDEPGLWGTVSRLDADQWINLEHRLLWLGRGGASNDPEDIRNHFATLKFGAPTLVQLSEKRILVAFWCVVDGVSQISTILLSREQAGDAVVF